MAMTTNVHRINVIILRRDVPSLKQVSHVVYVRRMVTVNQSLSLLPSLVLALKMMLLLRQEGGNTDTGTDETGNEDGEDDYDPCDECDPKSVCTRSGYRNAICTWRRYKKEQYFLPNQRRKVVHDTKRSGRVNDNSITSNLLRKQLNSFHCDVT